MVGSGAEIGSGLEASVVMAVADPDAPAETAAMTGQEGASCDERP